MKPPVPGNERERLAALGEYRILDTPPEAAYDDITLLAARLCASPIALITLVDGDRLWFKSRVGLEAAATPRDAAFCAHAILTPDDVLVVPDARADPRFTDNLLVTEAPGIRFYAGVPRTLMPEQAAALRALRRQVVNELELRRYAAEQREERFRQIAENIREVFWMATAGLAQILYVSPAYEEIWGRSCESLYASPRSFTDAIHPEDRPGVEGVLSALHEEGRRYDVEYRVLQPDGQVRWVHDRGFPVRDREGRLVRVVGLAEDVSERKRAEPERERLLARERTARLETEALAEANSRECPGHAASTACTAWCRMTAPASCSSRTGPASPYGPFAGTSA